MNKDQAKRISLNITARWSAVSNSHRWGTLSGAGISMDDINYELTRDSYAEFQSEIAPWMPSFRVMVFSGAAMVVGILVMFLQIVDKSGTDVLSIDWWKVSAAAVAGGLLAVKRNNL